MRWKQITEAPAVQHPPENVNEALWWVIRYVSGSLNDPDWDWGKPNKLNVDTAMEVASRYIGNKKSVGVPLSRYLLLNKNDAQKLVKTKMLPPYGNGFQSFTTHGRKEAVEIGREIAFGRTQGMIEVVVTVVPPASEVLFGYEDVKRAAKKRLPGVGDLFDQWDDNWGHQGEVLVRINAPLACEVKVITKKSGLKEEEGESVQFRIEKEPIFTDGKVDPKQAYFHAYDGDKFAASLHMGPSRDGRTFSAVSVWVNSEYRRMGLATRLYNATHEAGFQPITPDHQNLKPDGAKFWDAHMQGKWKMGQRRPEMKWTPEPIDEGSRSSYERKAQPGQFPATPENIAAAKAFVMKKWQERAVERGGPNATLPDDLSYSCKFTSLFARAVFGGKLEGNHDHQFVRGEDGEIIDLNLDAADVKALGDKAHRHDAVFWGSSDHKASVKSCQPRVKDWVAEFLRR